MSAPTNNMRKRIHVGVVIGVLIFAAYIGINLSNISVVNAEYYRSKANTQQLDTFTINANRGTIYDVNGKILAQSSTVWDVIISPGDIAEDEPEGNMELICQKLSEICGVDYDTLYKACQDTSRRYYIVKTKVDKEAHDLITQFQSEYEIAGDSINLIENTKRSYPNETLASSVIGFTNYDNVGVYGVEAYYDEYLQGVDGKVVTARDANGSSSMPYEYETRYEAKDGNSLYLTIDEVLQHYLEKNLETVLTQHQVDNRATGIIMDVNTGAILAMASAPGYDLNYPAQLSDYYQAKLDAYEQELLASSEGAVLTEEELDEKLAAAKSVFREQQWNNKAISELYFPGSVFKVITAASALEEQVVDLETSSFYCQGFATVADTNISCWSSGGHGTLNLQWALIKSCNPAFIAIGQMLGAAKFCDYFEAFGFTEKTGVDLPGESSSIYVDYENMGLVELASSSFGQTNKVTPLQMITAYCAAINGGYLVTPHVVDKIVDSEGNVIKSAETEIKRQVISEDTSATMRQLLWNVVEENGGSNAYISGYKIGGKSGTSEKLDEYPKSAMRYVSTFCAFTPADDPQIAMLVIVDEPMSGTYYGSAVAAPVVSAVFSECLEYLGIYAQYTAEELAEQNTTVPYLTGMNPLEAVTKLNAQGLKCTIIGSETGTITDTVPGTGATIPKNGTVVVYTDGEERLTATVPNVLGMTVDEANAAITNAGLNISLSGGAINNESAKASAQSIEYGTEVYKGAVIEVTFVVNDETG